MLEEALAGGLRCPADLYGGNDTTYSRAKKAFFQSLASKNFLDILFVKRSRMQNEA